MALTSTLYTGLSGMNVNQQRLNVIGNNIANVNTVAFKSSRALFKPQFYVTDASGSAPTSSFGGTNPSQRGLGAQVASIEKNFSQGSIETTGLSTDMAIDGDGFFIVGNSGVTGAADQQYTRDGSFVLNQNNELVNSAGQFVQGFGVDKNFNVLGGTLSKLTIPLGTTTIAEATSAVDLKGNLNADGELATGASVLQSAPMLDSSGATPTDTTLLTDLRPAADPSGAGMFVDGQTLSLNGKRGDNSLPTASFPVTATSTVADLNEYLRSGMAIDNGTDATAAAPAGYTPGVGLAATTDPTDPAGSLRINLTGNAGKDNALAINGNAFTTDAGTVPLTFTDAANSDPAGESLHTSMTVYDSLGTPLQVDVTAVLQSKDNTGSTWRYFATSKDNTTAGAASGPGIILNSGTLSFDNSGVYKGATNNSISIDRSNSGATNPLAINLDFSKMTSLTDQGSTMVMDSQDGFATGELRDYSISSDGQIQGLFSNGLKRTLGQVAVAHFDNPLGLVDRGSNNYSVGASSGQAVVAKPGEFNTGLVRSGSLEQSNVDLSKEFIDMIVTSTGFSAASRVITTSDQLINELLQTTR